MSDRSYPDYLGGTSLQRWHRDLLRRSMEAEVRRILRETLAEPERPMAADLYQRIRARFAPLGGVDLDLPPREEAPDPPRFD